MKELKVFNGMEVEFIVLNDKVLFNAKCVGEILGIVDVNSVVRNFTDKQILKLKNSDVQDTQFRKLNNAGENFLTESGVYKLIMRSNKPEAEQFQDWVTDDLLPTIRKTGGYVANEDLFINTYLPFADDLTKQMFGGILATVRNQNETIAKQRDENIKLINKTETQHNLIDKMTECYDGLVLRATCRDYVNKKSRETGIHQAELYGKIYRLLGNVLKTDISYQYDKFTKEQRKLVEDNKRYNTANKLKGLDRKTPFKYTDSKMAISQIEYICDMLGQGAKLLEVMSKVFEVEITEIIDKYNFHSEKNQALMILDNKH